jgi:predicted ATPase
VLSGHQPKHRQRHRQSGEGLTGFLFGEGAAAPSIAAFLANQCMLIVLDYCDHAIDSTAVLVEQILREAALIDIPATSREPLQNEGEGVYRLPALEAPAPSPALTAAQALTFPAARLFVDRAAAGIADFKLSDADAPIVAEICHNLDRMPLAIELAGGRVDAFGTRGVAALLE